MNFPHKVICVDDDNGIFNRYGLIKGKVYTALNEFGDYLVLDVSDNTLQHTEWFTYRFEPIEESTIPKAPSEAETMSGGIRI